MKIRLLIFGLVFATTLVGSWLWLDPDPTPQVLTAQLWLPSGPISSSLHSDWALQSLAREVDSTLDLPTFQKLTFVESYSFLEYSPRYQSLSYVYLGRTADQRIRTSRISFDGIFPRRSVTYYTDWTSLTPTGKAGEFKVTNLFNLPMLIFLLLVEAIVLAGTVAVTFPKTGVEIWPFLAFAACGGANGLAFALWQIGKTGFATETFLVSVTLGVLGLWASVIVWFFVIEPRERHRYQTSASEVVLSTIVLLSGVAVETFLTVVFFGRENLFLENAGLFLAFLAPGLFMDLFGYLAHRQEGNK